MNGSTESLYEIFRKYPVVSTDSRNIRPGSMFFALKGASFNGNSFALEALEKGAAVAVVDEPQPRVDSRLVQVKDALIALQELARYHRNRFSIPVLAITGTNGKTTTKELVREVLSRKFRCICTEGNLNNHIGVPLTLLRITEETEFAVVEMGANHIGEISLLCDMALPEFGLITNIGKAHLEGFGGFEGVVQAKTELYRHIGTHAGTLFVNIDHPILSEHAAGLPRVTYGTSPDADVCAEPFTDGVFTGLTLLRPHPGTRVLSHLFGFHNFENILAAVCIGLYFGIQPHQMAEAISSYRPANNRSEIKETHKNLLIRDAYNANPSSMETALLSFSRADYQNKMVILGDMLELGEEAEIEHRKILELAVQLGFKKILLVGPVFRNIAGSEGLPAFATSQEAKQYLEKVHPACFTILIKGSRGIRLETVEEAL